MKTAKSVFLFGVLIAILFLISGCGENETVDSGVLSETAVSDNDFAEYVGVWAEKDLASMECGAILDLTLEDNYMNIAYNYVQSYSAGIESYIAIVTAQVDVAQIVNNTMTVSFDDDAYGHSGTLIIKLVDPNTIICTVEGLTYQGAGPEVWGLYEGDFVLTPTPDAITSMGQGVNSYDDYDDGEDAVANTDSVFAMKVTAEQNTQSYMSISKLIRNPYDYVDGNIYRFTGTVLYIDRDQAVSHGLMQAADSIIAFYSYGWLDAVEGDTLVLYGRVVGPADYTVDERTSQTAEIEAVHTVIGSGSTQAEFTDEMWEFILGTWYVDADRDEDTENRMLEDTVNLTMETINGRPYTILETGVGISNPNLIIDSAKNGSEYLYMKVVEETPSGESATAMVLFDLKSKMTHSASTESHKTPYISNYYRP